MSWRCRPCWRGHVLWQPKRCLTLFHHRFVLMQDVTLWRLLNRQLFQTVFYKYAVDLDFPWSSTTSLTMCTLYATITGLRAASTQKPCDIHFTRVFTCSVYTSSDSSCLLFATRVPSWTRFVDKSHRLVITTDRFRSNCRGKEWLVLYFFEQWRQKNE